MKQETLTDKARALSNLIAEKAKRIATPFMQRPTSKTSNETTRPDECREGNNTTITKLKLLHYERIRFHGRHR